MTAKQKILTTLTEEKQAIKSYGVYRLGVFGSFARRQEKLRSDVDVLVEFKQGKKTFDNYMDLKFFLERRLRRKVDLVVKGALKPAVKSSVAQEIVYASL